MASPLLSLDPPMEVLVWWPRIRGKCLLSWENDRALVRRFHQLWEALPVSSGSRGISRTKVLFDDDSLVANAGLILPATLMAQLGLQAVVDDMVCLVGWVGGALPGRKIPTVVAAILAG